MKLSFKLSLLFLLMAVIPVSMVGYFCYQNGRKTIERGMINHLTTTNIHKQAELERWIDANTTVIEMVSRTRFFKHQFALELKERDFRIPADLPKQKVILERYIKPFISEDGFIDLFILRAKDGKVLYSTDSRQEGKYFDRHPYFKKGLAGTYVQNVYYSVTFQKPCMTISTPLKDEDGNVIGVLAGRVDMTALSKIFQTRSQAYASEDSYLVNTFNFFITEPRFGKNYALKKTIFSKGVKAALAKRSGVDFYDDYRGVAVIGAYQWLEKRQLCLITKIDQAEAFAPIQALQKAIMGMGLTIALMAALTGGTISTTITRPLKRLVDGTVEIGKGKLTHYVGTSSRDEIGDLERAFNRMQEQLNASLVSRNELTKEIESRKLIEASLRKNQDRLRRAEAIGHLGNWRLDLSEETLSWSIGVYRLCNVDPNTYTPTYEGLVQLVHSEDRDKLEAFIERVILMGDGGLICRFILPDGRLRFGDIYGEVEKDASGATVSLFGTIKDITEVIMREQELEDKNAELERFTYTISHDLKSPIITIKTFAGYLEEDLKNGNQERINKDIFYIHTAAEKMNRLLDELLEMSRIGRVVNASEEVKWHDLINEALESVAGPIAEKNVDIHVAQSDLIFYGDRPRLVEIWQNLVENAVKYMGDQTSPHIEIGFNHKDMDVIFWVKDNGMGIDPRYKDKVFGWFEKLNPKSDGTGLGLALIKRIIELYGGRIWLESEGLGQGVCFYFLLPDAVNLPRKENNHEMRTTVYSAGGR